MLNVPYVKSSENACALACYTMTSKYFFPKTTFEEIAKVSDWEPGFVAWSYKFDLWIMNKGIKIEKYDLIDLEKWTKEGTEALRKSVSVKEFEFYKNNTKDLESLTEDIKKMMHHKNFIYHQEKPTFQQLEEALKREAVCEVVLDSHSLDNIEGFALHRVVVLEIKNGTVTFHDPRPVPRPFRKETIEHFRKAWLTAVNEPELCIYTRNNQV